MSSAMSLSESEATVMLGLGTAEYPAYVLTTLISRRGIHCKNKGG